MNHLIQAGIMISSGVAVILLTGKSRPAQVAGCVMGLAGQPLWFYTTWINGQWGIFLLSCVYACFYVRGMWVRRQNKGQEPKESIL